MLQDETENPVWRRFGRDHERPCKRPNILTCAQWSCQRANECQWDSRSWGLWGCTLEVTND
jgi:hypothetical protein